MIKIQRPSRGPSTGIWIGGAVAVGLLTVGILRYAQIRQASIAREEAIAAQETPLPRTAVVALGRIEPQGEVIHISGPTGERLGQLVVDEGDEVQVDQVLAYLESHGERQAERDVAVAQLTQAERALTAETEVGQSRIEAAQARIQQADRPKTLEIQAQEATIRRLEAELELARGDLSRFEDLFAEGAIAEQQLDEQRTRTRRVEEDLNSARATLVQVEESRLTDMAVAERELQSARDSLTRSQVEVALDSARQSVTLAEARLERTIIRAPRPGRVLQVFTRAGEAIASDGILDLGDTRQMVVVAEVYETDVSLVQVGQPATIISRNGAFEQTLTGTVTDIGWQIFKNDVLDDDPAANADARVVEVDVQLDDSGTVAALTNLQVDVRIDVSSP